MLCKAEENFKYRRGLIGLIFSRLQSQSLESSSRGTLVATFPRHLLVNNTPALFSLFCVSKIRQIWVTITIFRRINGPLLPLNFHSRFGKLTARYLVYCFPTTLSRQSICTLLFIRTSSLSTRYAKNGGSKQALHQTRSHSSSETLCKHSAPSFLGHEISKISARKGGKSGRTEKNKGPALKWASLHHIRYWLLLISMYQKPSPAGHSLRWQQRKCQVRCGSQGFCVPLFSSLQSCF